ncbi:DUF1911 domain-containing protein [Marinilabiliaceae bacterium JC017]|nr:DUF1911 domain-containing protein [Marinilabiliaceae bacterium JC017]
MRDKLKKKMYFNEFIAKKKSLMSLDYDALKDGKVADSKIEWTKFDILRDSIEVLIAEYSCGSDFDTLKKNTFDVIKKMKDDWIPLCTKVKSGSEKNIMYLNQYMVEPYGVMLRLLSLAFLLNVPDNDFQILIDVIDRDKISDKIYEFLIPSRFPNRIQKREEDYDEKKSVILKVYKNLRQAIIQRNKKEGARLVKKFLEKDFYNKHSGFFDNHKSKVDLYYGYWSFEAAAVTCILELDDSSYRDNQYYPKDLVDYYRTNYPLNNKLLGAK